MEKPKQYSAFKDHKFLFETDTPFGWPKNYVLYIDTRYSAKLRLYNYMKKKEKESIKARLTEMLTYQIEKLVKSTNFELDEIFDIFQNAIKQRSSYHSESEFLEECQKVALLTGGFLTEDINYMQELELKKCCKENDIKLLDYWTV